MSYRPEPSGVRELAQSAAIGAACLAAAERIAGAANAIGDSTYEAEAQTVTAGWRNERRAGAVARESTAHWRDWRDGVLLRVTAAMSVRGDR